MENALLELLKERTKNWIDKKEPLKDTDVYLGDGLYASFDGYQIILKANSHYSPTDTVCLEPFVIDKFLQYVDFIKEKIRTNESEAN